MRAHDNPTSHWCSPKVPFLNQPSPTFGYRVCLPNFLSKQLSLEYTTGTFKPRLVFPAYSLSSGVLALSHTGRAFSAFYSPQICCSILTYSCGLLTWFSICKNEDNSKSAVIKRMKTEYSNRSSYFSHILETQCFINHSVGNLQNSI